jgi:alpha-tubulin suppressor-like RCC1 family protein
MHSNELGYNTYLVGGETVGTTLPSFTLHPHIAYAMNTGEEVTSIVSGYANSAVMTNQGRTLIFGSNDQGQLATGELGTIGWGQNTPIPIQIYDPSINIIDIAFYTCKPPSSYYNTFVISDGCPRTIPNITVTQRSLTCATPSNLYSLGQNLNSQLGDGTTDSRYHAAVPASATFLSSYSIIDVQAGDSFYIGLAADRTLIGWGSTSGGFQFGDNSGGGQFLFLDPALVTTATALNGKTVNMVRCSSSSVNVLTTDNLLIGWGENLYGTFYHIN